MKLKIRIALIIEHREEAPAAGFPVATKICQSALPRDHLVIKKRYIYIFSVTNYVVACVPELYISVWFTRADYFVQYWQRFYSNK